MPDYFYLSVLAALRLLRADGAWGTTRYARWRSSPGSFNCPSSPFGIICPRVDRGAIAVTGSEWTIRALEFSNCNCSYGCPCQFNALPTHGNCRAVVGFQIKEGHHGGTKLDGLKVAGIFAWPGPIHQGHGEAALIIDSRASEPQRQALLRILTGQDTEPGATIFNVFASTLEKLHPPIFSDIEFEVDIDRRRARLVVPDHVDSRGEPILNPVTGAEHRVRIDSPKGFEFRLAEVGRGWSKTEKPITLDLADSYGHFCELNLCQTGVIA
jgi:hypothetical protein